MSPDNVGRVRAFRIACSEECEALFNGERSLQTNSAWPTTAQAWRTLHQGNLALHAAPNANLPWWLCSHPHVQSEDTAIRALAFVPPALPCFAGHFPEQPLLPAVIQLQWAIALAAKHWPEHAAAKKFAGTARLKFKAPVKPGDLIAVQLSRSLTQAASQTTPQVTNVIQFELRSHSAPLTSGRLNYRH